MSLWGYQSLKGQCRDKPNFGYAGGGTVPAQMKDFVAGPDPQSSRRAMEAMMGMRKLDIAALRSAAEGVAATR
jgi:predicted 3-demethylubiquinone-9 3-methyltransferase (glyoxalase superfamily)